MMGLSDIDIENINKLKSIEEKIEYLIRIDSMWFKLYFPKVYIKYLGKYNQKRVAIVETLMEEIRILE